MFPDFYGTFELLSFAKVCPIFCGSLSSQFDRNEIRQKLAQFLLLISGIYSLIFMEPFINYLWKLFKFSTFQSVLIKVAWPTLKLIIKTLLSVTLETAYY